MWRTIWAFQIEMYQNISQASFIVLQMCVISLLKSCLYQQLNNINLKGHENSPGDLVFFELKSPVLGWVFCKIHNVFKGFSLVVRADSGSQILLYLFLHGASSLKKRPYPAQFSTVCRTCLRLLLQQGQAGWRFLQWTSLSWRALKALAGGRNFSCS